MKNLYLILAILGFSLPNYFVCLESMESGNILLYADPLATLEGMFANRISTIFAIDLFFVVFVFFIWTYRATKKTDRKQLFFLWLITLMFGLACAFPLFLYLNPKKNR